MGLRKLERSNAVLISGCSGGGKSTLLAELAARGFATVEEPGIRIVRQEMRNDGVALPWVDLEAFARRAIEMASADLAAAESRPGWTFFDRGLIDAAAALLHATGETHALEVLADRFRYHDTVFLAPPWPEIYRADAERVHDFADAKAEHDRLSAIFPALGYTVALLPKVGVIERADFVLRVLSRC
jgi:predicted ATPase